ncbi:MAG: fimbrial protein FimV [Xanthomonadaceae bacterium]|nr:fimbrial protein FimV [Xanthomonadaceae bacterium]
MNRSLKLSLLVALALGSSQAGALELGQIRVKSALGQPLVAEIPVTPEGAGDLRNLSAKLASDEDFMRAGITDGRTSVPLSFAVVSGPGGSKLIRITSAEAINDPYLDLLVEVDNASGKSLREYTILLDPPGMTSAAPAPSPAPSRAAAPRAPAAASAPRAVASKGEVGPVKSGQTLSSIAASVRPDGVDLNQMLLALKQANPDAFYRDNINALKRGAVLRVPSAEQARATSIAAAMAEVRRQNSDWRAGAVSSPTQVADSGTRASASSSPTAPASKAGDHLELLPSAKGGKNASAGGGKAADLRRDLQQSQESLANLQQQSADLRSRLKDLEDINGKNQRLLALKDSEIAELQRKLAEARKGAPADGSAMTPAAAPAAIPPAPAASSAKPAVAAAQPATASTAAAGGTTAPAPATSSAKSPAVPAASTPKAAEPAAKPMAKPAAKAPAARVAPKPAASDEAWYMQPWAWAAGAAVVLLGLLLGLRGRRAKASGKGSPSSLADRFGTVPVPGDTGDGIDPDQDELLDQLAEHPDDIGLHLELVSLYYHRRDVEHFEAAAEAMYAHITDPQQSEWQDVAAMGEDLVPGHPLFAGVDTSVPESERAPLAGFNLDEPADDAGAAPVPPPMPAGPSKISEYHFDFNLTPRPGSPGAEHHEDASAGHAEDDVPEALDDHFALDTDAHVPASADHADEMPAWQPSESGTGFEPTEFSDDPIDTKLDLARAYLDMGDADGARAMLEEVLAEGSQMQRDTARRLLDGIA